MTQRTNNKVSASDLQDAVDWFFTKGYQQLAKNPSGPKQATQSSAFTKVTHVAETLSISPSLAIIMLKQSKHK